MSNRAAILKYNETVLDSIAKDFISNIQKKQELYGNNAGDDIYSFTSNRTNMNALLLGAYCSRAQKEKFTEKVLENIISEYSKQQQLLEQQNLEKKIKELNLNKTANSSYYVSKSGTYYVIERNDIVEKKQVINVDKDGNYTITDELQDCGDIIITTYDATNQPILIKIINANGNRYQSERYVAKKLNLKKEYVKKYKLPGYIGYTDYSKTMIANIRNFISEPSPSGYYADKNYRFFKWNKEKYQFEINLRCGVQPGAPMVSDYEIKDNTLVRTDYDGVGVVL